MTADPESEILNPEISLRTINFLARTYAQDSIRYRPQTDYWVNYLTVIGADLLKPDLIRKAEALKAASFIDQGQIPEAKAIL